MGSVTLLQLFGAGNGVRPSARRRSTRMPGELVVYSAQKLTRTAFESRITDIFTNVRSSAEFLSKVGSTRRRGSTGPLGGFGFDVFFFSEQIQVLIYKPPSAFAKRYHIDKIPVMPVDLREVEKEIKKKESKVTVHIGSEDGDTYVKIPLGTADDLKPAVIKVAFSDLSMWDPDFDVSSITKCTLPDSVSPFSVLSLPAIHPND